MLLQLFLIFLTIGATAFGGGYATLPLIQSYIVEQMGWISNTEMADILTISQMTPGPIAINAASFVGTKVAGPMGSVVATLGNILPQTIFMLIVGYFVFRGRRFRILDEMLTGLRPGVIGLIASATLVLFMQAAFPTNQITSPDWIVLIGFAVGLYFYRKGVDIFRLILAGAVLGIALYGMQILFLGA